MVLYAGWLIILTISLLWNIHIELKNAHDIVLNKSESFFRQIIVSRLWNATHGGVYVPVTETTRPNPYLADSLRDVITTEGLALTKINPAFMTRQIAEINVSNKNFDMHITSLDPIRPENKPDEWETRSLQVLHERRKDYVLERIKKDTLDQYRYMAPLITEQACMSCHSHQGYQIGDIRGGISVSFPADVFSRTMNRQIANLSLAHIILLITGWLGIRFYVRSSNRYVDQLATQNSDLVSRTTELNIINDKLARNIAEKDKFFSILAHDLRNPLFSIMGMAELLKDETKTFTPEELHKFISTIYGTSKNTFDLLEQLLEWGRIQQGKVRMLPSKIDVKVIFENICRVVQQQAVAKNIEIVCHIPEGLFVMADRQKTEAVIRNLISNAVKFSYQDTQIFVAAFETKDNWIRFEIKDEGIGMTVSQVDALFKPEFANSQKGTAGEKGTGMGLLLCYEFVTLQGGTIGVESEEEKGSIFYFTLPKA
jgi:signal transduction histidine kinase